MERFCELVAAMKLRTTNLKNRHLSTGRAIELLVEHGIETPDGLVRAPPGLLTRTTVNRYLRAWGLDDERMRSAATGAAIPGRARPMIAGSSISRHRT